MLAAALAGCGMGGASPAGPSLWTMVDEASTRNRVPARLAHAIVEAESDGDPQAISRAGAMGLMQILPGTARAYRVSDPFDPWQNLLGGTRYLHDLLVRYHGNVKLAVAAYNAGPAAVDRYHGIPPFHETRAYVSRVLADYGT